ncbi:hypothetical protein SESBI_28026 [Sesbania bispinosa]|nr:hypothetical protein SESBI_28026 [Sesbania bispinosa]
MDVICFDDNKEGMELKSGVRFPTSDFSDMDDNFGDPQVLPRVGDQYQAEIPSLIAAPFLSQVTKNLRDSDMLESFPPGFPIPLMKEPCKVQRSCGTLESVASEEGQVISGSECTNTKVESQPALLSEGQNVGGCSNLQSSFKFDETVIDSCHELKTELDQSRKMHLLPGLSEGHCRWSKCRKLRVRRCIWGQKIFTGWRQQELLSRLSSQVSGECQTMLVELSRNFREGKMPFEEYVFSVKDAVGIDLLIAAIGIGKGKQDLTGTAVKPKKTNHTFSLQSEIPIGKACSFLTSADIIKFLTGDFRLSKARSSDLFWEAVWPRLLAKGWHSEQPKDHVVSGSKGSLVFLIPGIKKFSSRLIKGNHYFDSISDILNKVASDPQLLEMKIQATEGNVDRDNGQDKKNLDGLSDKQQICYLQPLSLKCQDLMKCTNVDTGIVYDLDQCKVRELRSSSFQTMSIPTTLSHSSGSEQGTSKETDQAEQANSSNPVEEFSDKWVNRELSDCTCITEALNPTKEEEISREINEYQVIQKVTDSPKYLPLIMKKQKLTTCNLGELSRCTESTFTDRKLDLNESPSPSYQCEASEDTPKISNEDSAIENHLVGEVSAEKPKSRMLFDLNLPLFSPELEIETHVPSSMVILQNDDNQYETTSSSSSEITQLNETQAFPDGHKEQQPIILNRRQSTRNRPLTTKALEALEYGFLHLKRKRKNAGSSHNNSKSQCLHASIGTVIGATCDNDIGDMRAEKENVIQTYNSSINLNNCEDHYTL